MILAPLQTFEDFQNDKQALEYQQRIVDILLKVPSKKKKKHIHYSIPSHITVTP